MSTSTTCKYTLTDSNGTSNEATITVEVLASSMPNDIFLNPFNKLSVHHRPIGLNAATGIPAQYNNSETLVVSAGASGSRGRLSIVGDYRCSTGPKFDKLHIKNALANTQRTIIHSGNNSGSNLPVQIRLPTGQGLELYQSPAGDSNPGIFDEAQDSSRGPGFYHLFFGYQDDTSSAGLCHIYPLSGLDYPGSDAYSRGSSASSIRWPATILQDYEIMPENPDPIYHPFNVAVTRNQSGIAASLHVLSRYRTWPARTVDGSQTDNGNRGDIPYGALGFVTADDYAWLLANYTWTPRQRVILDAHHYYGVYFLDGNGLTYNGNSAVMQLRTSAGISTNVKNELRVGLNRILPRLSLLRNGRDYTTETEIHTDGLPYRGGGGPIDANSVNSAYDA